MFSQLKIVTTDRQVDLLGLNHGQPEGYGLESYLPGRPNFKGGGAWQDSPLAPGRRLAFAVKGNVSDALTIKIAARYHDVAIRLQNELDELLEQAIAYWIAEDTTDIDPVWLMARVPGERAARYALLYSAELGEYPDPYVQPYAGQLRTVVLNNITIGLERSEWRALPPGELTEVPISNPRDSTPQTGGIYVMAQSGPALTVRAYRYDASAGTYSAELNAGPYPYNLFPSPMGLGDILYLRTDTGGAFSALVFNTGTTGSSFSFSPEIWNGASWGQVNLQVNGPANWTIPGERIIEWIPPTSWQATTVSTFGSARWIRFVAQGTSATVPTQVAALYVPNQPYIEVAADQIGGSMDALAMVAANMEQDRRGSSVLRVHIFGQLMAGLRSVDRGSDFNAYLNPGSLPTGITFSNSASAYVDKPATGFANSQSPYTNVVEWLADASDVFGEMFRLNFNAAAAAQYKGTYRLFVRYGTTLTSPGYSALMRYRLLTVYPSNSSTTPNLIEQAGDIVTVELRQTTSYSQPWSVADLGRITLPPIGQLAPDEQSQGFSLILDGYFDYLGGQNQHYIMDLILLPIDEWAAQLDAGLNLLRLDAQDVEWTIDSIQQPKTHLRSLLRYSPATETILGSAERISNGPMILHAGRQQRLWFFMAPVRGTDYPAGSPPQYRAGYPLKVRLYKLQRYHYLRGE